MSWRRKTAIALMLGFSMLAGLHTAGTPAWAKDTKPAAGATALIDLNSATAAELEALPGIGPAKAKAIIDGRPYASLKDFESRNIVAASTVEKFKDQVTVAKAAKPAATAEAAPAAAKPAAPAGKIDLNSATVDELETLPGIGPVKAKAIVDGRPYASLKDFESRNILPASAFDKVKADVTVAKATKAAATETAPATKAAEPAAPAGKIDLNSATTDELQTLPGIGPVKAKAIVDGRPYSSLKNFESRNILAASVFDRIKGDVTVSKAAKAAATEAAPETKTAAPAAPAGKIDLNTATTDELQTLTGIGPVKAKAIADGRPYSSLKDFESRNILAASVFDKIRDSVTVAKAPAKAKPAVADTPPDEANPPEPLGKINLNTATAEELEVLPGIGPVKAKAIIDGRPYSSISDFEAKGIVAKSTVEKFKDAIEVDAPAAKTADKTAEATTGTPGQVAAQKRIRMCGAKWRAAKAEGKIPAGLTWPQFWSQCNTALKKQGY